MGWQLWLAAPMAVTLAAALLIWWQARPRATPSVHARVRDHDRFLDALGRHSGPPAALPSSVELAAPPSDPAPADGSGISAATGAETGESTSPDSNAESSAEAGAGTRSAIGAPTTASA